MRHSRFGRFEIVRRLGAGSVGEVLLASDGRRRFALKRLLPHLADAASATTFATEAALATRLLHRNIVAVLDHGTIDETPYLLMEYVDGKTLHQLLRALETRPPGLAAFVVAEVCRALAYVHAAVGDDGQPLGLIHRDVSPSNVLLSRDGEVKLCDFGIAKSLALSGPKTATGLVKGKLEYLSPEQAASEPLDARTDLFSAGTLLYEALTGRCPFAADDDATVVARVRAAVVERPSRFAPEVPPELDGICARALAREREQRYASAVEMAAALDAVVAASGFDRAALAACMQRLFAPRAAPAVETTRTLVQARGARRWVGGALVAAGVATGVWLVATRQPELSAPPARSPTAAVAPSAEVASPTFAAGAAAVAPAAEVAASTSAAARAAIAPTASAAPAAAPRARNSVAAAPAASPKPDSATMRARPMRAKSPSHALRHPPLHAGKKRDFMPDPFH